jgi:hypothetical protein
MITSSTNKAVFLGDGVTTVFPFTFHVEDEDHLAVYEYTLGSGVLTLVSPANYSVTGVPGTGSVTYNPGGVPVPGTKRLVLLRTVPYTQDLDIQNQGGFHPDSIEDQLDLMVMQIQQIAGVALLRNPGEVGVPDDGAIFVGDGTGYFKDSGENILTIAGGTSEAIAAADAATDAALAATASASAAAASAAGIDFTKDTDGTMAANSDSVVPSQKATVTYVAAAIAALRGGVAAAYDTMSELASGITTLIARQIIRTLAVGAGTGLTVNADDVALSAASIASLAKADAALLTNTADQVITGGARVTTLDLGNLSGTTITPDPGDRPIQKITNNGAGTISPGSNQGSYLLVVKNTTGAGAITTSGWQDVSGEAFDTTTTSEFLCHCTVVGDFSAMVVNKVA